MSCWNIAEAVYRIGDSTIAERPALIHGEEVISYRELRRRASGIAGFLRSKGIPVGAHVGHYMRNSNAYLETFTGAALAGMAHVNVNYRYLDEELIGLCNGLDIQVLVYDTEFAPRVAAVLRSTKGDKTRAAKVLGISRTALYQKLKRHSARQTDD